MIKTPKQLTPMDRTKTFFYSLSALVMVLAPIVAFGQSLLPIDPQPADMLAPGPVNPQATITVLNANGNVPLGTMANLENGSFSFQTTIAPIAAVNIKSNLGGSTRQGTTVVP